MNRIQKLFSEKNNILSIYFTAGFPGKEDTGKIVSELIRCGTDLIEIGIPFSDPLADGPVIQHSSEVALRNGMNLNLLFKQLESFGQEEKKRDTPLLLMGYLNPVLQFGMENFCRKARECGIDGVILPDLPLSEYLEHYEAMFKQYGLVHVFLVTPQTSEARIRLIDSHSDGFIYLVSSASTTGVRNGISEEQSAYFQRIKNLRLRNPCLIGFGISDQASFSKACDYAAGAIIGSAFIRALEKDGADSGTISAFVKGIRTQIQKVKA